MERVAIFAALHWECRPVLRQLRQVSRERSGPFRLWRGVTPRYDVVLVKTGIGIEQAEAAACVIANDGPFHLFVSTGCAGALSPALAPGDVALATAIVGGHAHDLFAAHSEHRAAAERAATRAGVRVTSGRVLCSPHALVTAEQKRLAAAQHDAVAVEMEGAAIAALAGKTNTPFISVRVILDTADTELRHVGRFIEPQTGAVKPLALAGFLATHPAAVADMIAMQRMMRATQTALERFFAAWFSAP